MTTPEFEELLARHFDGDEDGRLDQMLSEDAAAQARFAGLTRIHGLLRAREASDHDRDRLADGIRRAVELEERRRRLTSRVLHTLGERRRPASARTWPALVAVAALAFVVIVLASLRSERPPARTSRHEVPVLAPVMEPERPPAPGPPPAPVPKFEVPTPPPPPPPPAPVEEKKTPPVPPEPVPIPKPMEPPKKTAPEPPKVRAVAVQDLRGTLTRKRGGESVPVQVGSEIAREDSLATPARRGARLALPGIAVTLERGSTLLLEQEEGGATRVTLSEGAAFFEVEKRTSPLVVALASGEAVVVGTSFLADRSSVSVLEGAVRVRNDRGEVLVRAGQRSTLKAGEKPSAPAKVDVDALAAWRKRPELVPNPERTPFLEREPGANRKLPGLVLAAPYGEGEPEAERLAHATAERLDAALVVGHHYRDVEKRRWINVDRAMEADVRDDGTPGKEAFTDRARKATGEYLDQLRAGAGAGPREPVSMLVQFRNHYDPALEGGEVAVAGWNKATIAGLKALYAQLLEKHKPSTKLDLRFQGVDDTYEVKGVKRTFAFTEADARIEGAMAPKNARNAITLFLSPAFGKRAEDVDAWARILAEMVEYLHARRK